MSQSIQRLETRVGKMRNELEASVEAESMLRDEVVRLKGEMEETMKEVCSYAFYCLHILLIFTIAVFVNSMEKSWRNKKS
jgi:galactokinase/mevalonate kinase-like predicted kinase